MTELADLLRFAVEHHADPSTFACHEHRHGCDAYHATSPLLHHIGFFQSYERYPRTIRSAVAAMPGATVAVAGVESELSAEALLRALPTDERRRVTFFDRCQTPLRRIALASDAAFAQHDVFTVSADILGAQFDASFDVVLADSFVKQFGAAEKPRALERLAGMARSSGSLLVMREYIGELGRLLCDFWACLPGVLERCGLHTDHRLETALAHVRAYMNSVPATYGDDAAFQAALACAGLRVLSYEHRASSPYAVVVASPRRPRRAARSAS
jgi:hypothetical protein